MDKLRQLSARVPTLLTDIVGLLLTGSDDDIKDYMPILVKGIKNVAGESKRLSEETADQFNQTALLIDEVTLASKHSEGKSHGDLEEAKNNAKVAEMRKKELDKLKEEHKEALEKAKEDAEEAETNYKEALDNIPTGWELLGMKLTETAIDLTKSLSKMAMEQKFGAFQTFVKTEVLKKGFQITDKALGLNKPHSMASKFTKNYNMKLLESSTSILNAAIQDFSGNLFEQGSKGAEDLNVKCSEKQHIGQIRGFLNSVKEQKSKQVDLQATIEKTLEDAITSIEALLSQLDKHCQGEKTIDTHTLREGFRQSENQLNKGIRDMKVLMRESTTTPPAKLPKQTESSEKKSVVEETMKNSQIQVTQTKEMLKFRVKKAREEREAWTQVTHEFMKVQEEIISLDAKIATLADILKLLKKALKILAQLSEQWRKMADFFNMINTMVQTWEEGPQTQFIEIVEKGYKNVSEKKRMSSFVKKMMFGYARESAGYAFVINRVSSGYFKISSKYLLIPMASLKELMTLDSAKDNVIMQKKKNLQTEAKKAMAAITILGEKEADRTKTMLEKRMKDIDREFNGILSRIPPLEKSRIIKETLTTMKSMKVEKTAVSIVQGNLQQYSAMLNDEDDPDFLDDI